MGPQSQSGDKEACSEGPKPGCGTVRRTSRMGMLANRRTVFKPRGCSACCWVTSSVDLRWQKAAGARNCRPTRTKLRMPLNDTNQAVSWMLNFTYILMPQKSRVNFPVQMRNLALNTPRKSKKSVYMGWIPKLQLRREGLNIVINWLTRKSHLRRIHANTVHRMRAGTC